MCRGLRHNVDDAIDGIGAPERGAGSANHFNAVDVLQHRVLHVPENAGEQRSVNRPPVDHHEQLVGERVVEAARADGPGVLIDARHFHARRAAQRFGNARGARAANVFAGDDVRCGR